jgi:hypothetical protein
MGAIQCFHHIHDAVGVWSPGIRDGIQEKRGEFIVSFSKATEGDPSVIISQGIIMCQ